MCKAKYCIEMKQAVVKEYLSGEGSYEALAKKHGIGSKSIKDWVRKYREHGKTGLQPRHGNSSYSSAFKMKCVEAVLRGEGSVDDIVAKYNISAREVLRSWIRRYNANKELKDYDPKREVYMADARRKTTLEERKEITVYLDRCGSIADAGNCHNGRRKPVHNLLDTVLNLINFSVQFADQAKGVLKFEGFGGHRGADGFSGSVTDFNRLVMAIALSGGC